MLSPRPPPIGVIHLLFMSDTAIPSVLVLLQEAFSWLPLSENSPTSFVSLLRTYPCCLFLHTAKLKMFISRWAGTNFPAKGATKGGGGSGEGGGGWGKEDIQDSRVVTSTFSCIRNFTCYNVPLKDTLTVTLMA